MESIYYLVTNIINNIINFSLLVVRTHSKKGKDDPLILGSAPLLFVFERCKPFVTGHWLIAKNTVPSTLPSIFKHIFRKFYEESS